MALEIKRIFIDMDDTMCDYKGAYSKARAENKELLYPQSQPGFFRGLEILDKSTSYIEIIADLGHDIWILTRPSYKNRHCYSEKAEWICDKMGEEWVQKLIICPDKGLLKGDLLIDDIEWPTFEGDQILYNKNSSTNWENITSYIEQGFKL